MFPVYIILWDNLGDNVYNSCNQRPGGVKQKITGYAREMADLRISVAALRKMGFPGWKVRNGSH
jgi:hypothetical protein